LFSIPGTEALSPAVKYVIAFVVIFVLLALFALVLRRITGGRLALPGQDRGRARQPRLGIVDVYDLDRQRQLILLRRDNVEHLLLIGGPNDVVVETNIVRVPGARLPAGSAAEFNPERLEAAFEAPPRPVMEPPRPEPVVAARLGSHVGRPNGGTEPTARTEPVLKPDMVALTPAQPAPPQAAPAPARSATISTVRSAATGETPAGRTSSGATPRADHRRRRCAVGYGEAA
jgi:flagellar protein FliO/FliZ